MTNTKTRSTGIAALTLGLLATYLITAPIAQAGFYDVHACETPRLGTPNNSWAGVGSYPGYTGNCEAATGVIHNRGLVTRMVPGEAGKPSVFSNGQWSGLHFQAPPGTTIAGIIWSGRLSVDYGQWRDGLRASGGAYLVGRDRCPSDCLFPTAPAIPTYFAAPAGTTYLQQFVQCASTTGCNTGAAMNTHWSQVRLSDNVGPGAAIAGFDAEQWTNKAVATGYGATDGFGGGVRQVYVRVDNGPARSSTPINAGCDITRTVPCPRSRSGALTTGEMTEGRRKVDVVAVDAGGNTAVATRYVRVDKTKPRQVSVAVAGGEGWRRRNGYSASWTPISDGASPIVGGSYELCKPGRKECTPARALTSTSKLDGLQVPGDGTWELRVALADQAGNVADFADARVATLRLDTQPPALEVAKQDPNDPLRVQAPASDNLSGVASGQIEIRRHGTTTWQELPTTVQNGALEATIDDERRPDGKYDLRATAVDGAGNQAATGVLAAARSLPARIKTTLRAKMARTVRRRGRNKIKLTTSRRVRYGHKYQVRGRLVTRDGQPLDDTAVNVYAKPDRLGATYKPIGVVRTNRNGKFLYRAKARQSRILRLRYEGSRRVRASTAQVRLKVPARVSITVTPNAVLNGEYATFAGRVKGPIPPGGKLVALEAYTGGRWGTFDTVRTDPKGRYKQLKRFTGTRGNVRYRIRAVATREPLFPYHTGASRPIRIRVRGL